MTTKNQKIDDARDAILDAIIKQASESNRPENLLQLANAVALLEGKPRGGAVVG